MACRSSLARAALAPRIFSPRAPRLLSLSSLLLLLATDAVEARRSCNTKVNVDQRPIDL
jgi:hypothetical protein